MTQQTSSRWLRAVPNTLTIARLALAAGLPMAPEGWRVWIVLAAGLSDLADGVIARRFGATSAVGGLLDAATDKVFLLSAIGTLLAGGIITWWQAAIALARDLVVAVAAVRAAAGGLWFAFLKMSSRLAGKATTAFMFAWFLALFAQAPDWLAWGLFTLTAVSSVAAAVDYAVRMADALRRRREETSAA